MKKNNSILADSVVHVRNFLATTFITTINLLFGCAGSSAIYSGINVVKAASGFRSLIPYTLCLLTIICSCENDPKDIENWTKKADMKEEAKNIESYLSQGGVLKAKLVAPLMYRYQKDTIITEFPNTLKVDFYDDSMRVESWLTSLYGKYMENLNKVYLRDSVTVINTVGDTLRCPELWWDQNQQKFYTDKPARLDGKDKHITGNQGLEATQDLKVITFRYPTGPFQVKDGTTPE